MTNKNVGIVFICNKLLNKFLIIFTYQNNDFSIKNTINHNILLALKKLVEYKNNNNKNRLKHK